MAGINPSATYKKATEGMVGQGFTCDPTLVFPGDLVMVTGDMTVGFDATKPFIGEVITVDKTNLTCVVELKSAKIFNAVVGATPVVAGNFVKAGATKNLVIPAAVDEASGLASTTAIETSKIQGIALEGGATGATIRVMQL